MNVTPEEHDYLFIYNKWLAEITAQGRFDYPLTANELDYMQKATGMVNTFANLSPKEKALYDKAVASGNREAAAGISQIAFIHMIVHTAGDPNDRNGRIYDGHLDRLVLVKCNPPTKCRQQPAPPPQCAPLAPYRR